MPLVTLTVRKPKPVVFKTKVLDAVHASLVSSGVPQADLFQRVFELEADDFRFDPSYPDVASPRTSRPAGCRVRRCWHSSRTCSSAR